MLIFGCLAALNLSLAFMVGRVRPRGPGNAYAAMLFIANAGDALVRIDGVLTGPGVTSTSSEVGLVSLFSAVSFLALIMLALVYPWRRLSPARERWVLSVGILLIAAYFLGHPRAPLTPGAGFVGLVVGMVVFNAGFYGSAIVATLLFLDAFLSSRGAVRRQVQFLLAALVLKDLAYVLLAKAPNILAGPAPEGVDPLLVSAAAWMATLGVAVAVAAVPVALLAERLRTRAAPAPAAPALFVLAALGGGAAVFGFLPLPDDAFIFEFLLVRPMLIVYGILGFQMLNVESRPNRAAIAVAVLAAMGALFALSVWLAEQGGIEPGLAVSLAFLVTVGGGGALSIPLLRLLFAGDATSSERRLLVYRTALEAASHERGDGAFEALRPLRQELGVSDREHASLLAEGPAAQADGALRPGTLFLGRYRVARELGRGSGGEVYLARDERLGREVAVKRLADHLRRDAVALERFRKEIRLASAIQHGNIVAVHDVETVGHDAYLVMEYLPGGNLAERLRAGPMPEDEARLVALDVLAALAALNERGIVHRDVKPSNVLLDERGRAKLGDFTVAREAVSGETVGLTRAGGVVGTPAFMSPEQARGLPATARSDIYSTGATLYAALAGRPPVQVDGLSEFDARLRVAQEAPALPLAQASASLNKALARALAKDPDERYATAAEMARALAA